MGESHGTAFRPFEVDSAHLAYTILGGFIVLFGLFSLFIKERIFIGEAVIATLVGIIAGPYVTGGFNPKKWGGEQDEVLNEITLEVTRVIIAISVFAVGVELPKAYMRKHLRSLAFMLGPIMVFGWFITAALMYAIIPGLTFLSCLVIAACVTPTDPILAQAVIGGRFAEKHVPAHLRHLLAAESGCNDGAAFPFLYIAIYLILDASDAHAVGEWFYIVWLYEIALGIIIGALLGFSARKVMKFCEQHSLIDRQSFVAQYISLAVLTIGIVTLLGSDDLLAAFACGTAFAWDGFFNKQTEESFFSNVIDLLFNTVAFIYIGAIIPFDQFNNADLTLSIGRLFGLMISVMFLRRLPVVLALYRWIPDVHTFREALFTGHFGPMGVGAIFIATLAQTKLPPPVYPPTNQVELLAGSIKPIVSFLVLCSVIIHGLSIPFFSLGRRVHTISRTHSIGLVRTNDSRMRSIDDRTQRPEPAWLSGMRRVVPGQEIRINRDDDGDDLEKGPMDREEDRRMTPSGSGSGGSVRSGSSTAGNSPGDEKSTGFATAKGHDGQKKHSSPPPRMEDESLSELENEAARTATHETATDEEMESEGRKTPPLQEYREGNDLIIERAYGENEDVEVKVIKNFYHKSRGNKTTRLRGPREGVQSDIKHIMQHWQDDMESLSGDIKSGLKHLVTDGHGASERRHFNRDRQEEPQSKEEAEERELAGNRSPSKKKKGGVALTRSTKRYNSDGEEENVEADEEADDWADENERVEPQGQASARSPATGGVSFLSREASASSSRSGSPVSGSSTPRAPAIFIQSRPTGRRREGLRKKLFGSSSKSSITSPVASTSVDPSLLAPPARGRKTSTSLTDATAAPRSPSADPSLRSPPAIRFTDTAPPSSSAASTLGDGEPSLSHRRVGSTSSTTRPILETLALPERTTTSGSGGVLLNSAGTSYGDAAPATRYGGPELGPSISWAQAPDKPK